MSVATRVSLLLFVLVAVGITSPMAAPIQLQQGTAHGSIGTKDPIVLEFGDPVPARMMDDGFTVTAQGRALAMSVRQAGTRVILRPETSWPAGALSVTLSDEVRASQSGGLTSSVAVFVRTENPFPTVAERSPRQSSEVAANGSIGGGVEVYPLPFTPNRDGYNDLLHITRTGEPFVSPLVEIFSIDGVNVMSLGPSVMVRGEMIWDGVTRLGQEARPGPYFIIVKDQGDPIASGVIYILR